MLKILTIILGVVLAAFVIFCGWLFFWPLLECWYAQSWDILLSDNHKFMSFIFGGIVFWIGSILGIRVLI